MLRYMLDSHPEITCHGEVFTARGISRFLKADKRPYGLSPLYKHLLEEFKSRRIEHFISNHLLSGLDQNSKASGFKFKTDEYFKTSFTDVAKYIRSHTEIKIIHLKRRDLLAQYISHEMVNKRKSKTVVFDETYTHASLSINISIRNLMDFMGDVIRREKLIAEEMCQHDIIEVFYEDIIKENNQSIDDLQLFLNVTPQRLHMKTKKILTGYRSLIKNEAEVISALQSSKFASRCVLI